MEFLAVGVAGLLAIAWAASVGPRLRIASPLILVVLGIAISVLPVTPEIEVDPEWILAGVLPPLLYAAAVAMPAMDFRRDFRAISGMSVALVAVSAVALGFLFHALIPGLPLAAGIALGAIVSPTDAVATSIVRRVGVAPRITAVLQGESLLNDATALALLRSAVAVSVLAGVTTTAGDVVGDFARSVVIAVAVGWLVGWLNLRVRARVSDPGVNTVISFAVPFVASIPVELLDASGLVAAVVAGLVTGHGAPRWLSPGHRASDVQTWRVVELVLEGAIFLLMGLELSAILNQVQGSSGGVGLAVGVGLLGLLAALVVRAGYVALLVRLLNRHGRRSGDLRVWLERKEQEVAAMVAGADDGETPRRLGAVRRRIARKRHDLDYYDAAPLGWREGGVLTWAGMRGVVTLVAAQTLPTTVPNRHLLVLIAFVVAATSLLVQGGTLAMVVRWLRPAMPDPGEVAAERTRLADHLLRASVAELAEAPDGEVPARVREKLARLVTPGAGAGAGGEPGAGADAGAGAAATAGVTTRAAAREAPTRVQARRARARTWRWVGGRRRTSLRSERCASG
ncbi:cation:proton antiporter [Litorihabitans aurantiacus]|uniref:Peptidase n=1 Tax=Litorihabitans aurantiacus TaxID=1930061 RepID=A0AA37XGF8_9MICO|nr:sodium:proton antiporter [Litorihabitans aurantiacus]GMA32849.1 peptidase [Litorihabitans aurantiacus]